MVLPFIGLAFMVTTTRICRFSEANTIVHCADRRRVFLSRTGAAVVPWFTTISMLVDGMDVLRSRGLSAHAR